MEGERTGGHNHCRARKGVNYMLDILMAYIRPYMKREEGQALVEYALILSLVSVAAVGTLTILGTSVSDIFDTITGSL